MILLRRLVPWGFLAVLTWSPSSGNVEGYRIYRASGIQAPFVEVGTVAGNVTTYTDTVGGFGDCWRVTAFNSDVESQPSNNGCLIKGRPTAPGLQVK